MLDLAFHADRDADQPIYRQLGGYLRDLIASGRLAPGEKLPATRDLAADLEIGRNTVNQAYQCLIDEGALVAHVGQGTFVSSRPAALAPREPKPGPQRAFAWSGLLARAARSPIPPALLAKVGADIRFDLGGGRVDTDALPLADLRRAYTHALEQLPRTANDLDPLGHSPLREAIARNLVSRGIECSAREVLVVSGAQQALDLVCRVLIDPGDAVAIEQPGYFGAALCFQAAGAQLVGIDVDADGLRTDALARVLRGRRLKLVYTTPSAQMPTGVSLSGARRRALIELADETQTPILEDDYDSEFRFDNPALPALKTLDAAGQVIYVGTFSKALFGGLRLGYVVAAPALLGALALARMRASFASDVTTQAAVAHLLETGALERHVRRTRRRYAKRRAALRAALEQSMPPGTTWSDPGGGLLVWSALPPEVDADALHAAALAEGISYLRGDACTIDGSRGEYFGLSFANHSEAEIVEAVSRIGELAHQHRARRSA